jgi:hypothetical protein
MTTMLPPPPSPNRAGSAIPGLLLFALIVFIGVKVASCNPTAPTANVAATGNPPAAVAAAPKPAGKSAAAPPRHVPLKPPPASACVANWCGKKLGFASIIVDVGRRETKLPQRAWEIAVATALQESGLKNQATATYPETLRFPYDKVGDDHDSVGLFQQRPSQGWGTPSELMDPRIAAARFYKKLGEVVTTRRGWEKERLTVIAQAVQRSGFPEAYQKHETNAKKIVALVLEHVYTGPEAKNNATKNNWFVMVQCQEPTSRKCRAVPWQLAQPVVDNHAAFKAAFPKAALNDHLGNAPHQNVSEPLDHTSIGASCVKRVCNVQGWVYAQDFGNGDEVGTGFDLNHFGRWLVDQLRAGRYNDHVKYVITRIPGNRGTAYYGIMDVRHDWRAQSGVDGHENHVHISYKPGAERMQSTIIADYVRSRGATRVALPRPSGGGVAPFLISGVFLVEYNTKWRTFTALP